MLASAIVQWQSPRRSSRNCRNTANTLGWVINIELSVSLVAMLESLLLLELTTRHQCTGSLLHALSTLEAVIMRDEKAY